MAGCLALDVISPFNLSHCMADFGYEWILWVCIHGLCTIWNGYQVDVFSMTIHHTVKACRSYAERPLVNSQRDVEGTISLSFVAWRTGRKSGLGVHPPRYEDRYFCEVLRVKAPVNYGHNNAAPSTTMRGNKCYVEHSGTAYIKLVRGPRPVSGLRCGCTSLWIQ